MNTHIKLSVLFISLGIALSANAATVTDVGTLARPVSNPTRGTTWALSSTAVDINNAGQVAGVSIARGPIYGCGFRNAQKCQSVVETAFRYDAGLVPLSISGRDKPVGINENGDIYGSAYTNQFYYPGAGRIWGPDGSVKVTTDPVINMNDLGQYVTEGRGTFAYYSSAFNVDGSLVDVAGIQPGTYPQLIANDGNIAGVQQIQTLTADAPDITGAGWFLTQSELDVSPVIDGVYDDLRWFDLYPSPAKIYSQYDVKRTVVLDNNIVGDVIIATINSFTYPAGSMICGRLLSDSCEYHYSPEGTRRFLGINDNRDAVGILYTTSAITSGKLTVWLNDGAGLVANDLDMLIAGSGYKVVSVGDINNDRQIAATCTNAFNEQRACIINI